LFVEFPVEEGHAAGPVVDELPGAQLTGDGQDEFIESVVGSPVGRQGGRGRELGQDLPVPGRLRGTSWFGYGDHLVSLRSMWPGFSDVGVR
jgi:hypothetical protein